MISSKSLNSNKSYHLIEIAVVFLFSLSLLTIFAGVSGIIENKSPANLSTVWTVIESFITYFNYHTLIIFGALALTVSVWLASKNIT